MLRVAILMLCLSLSPAFAVEVTVPAGEEVPLPGTDITVRLTGVRDVRCPSGGDGEWVVLCLWEGEVHLTLTLTDAAGQSAEILLCNICDDATHQAVALGQHITFIRLEPGRNVLDRLDRPVLLSDYRVLLRVRPE
jgi:hypothetical protein